MPTVYGYFGQGWFVRLTESDKVILFAPPIGGIFVSKFGGDG